MANFGGKPNDDLQQFGRNLEWKCDTSYSMITASGYLFINK